MYTHSHPSPATAFFTPYRNSKGSDVDSSDTTWADANARNASSGVSFLNDVDPLSASMISYMERSQEQKLSHPAWVARKVAEQQQTHQQRVDEAERRRQKLHPHYSFDLNKEEKEEDGRSRCKEMKNFHDNSHAHTKSNTHNAPLHRRRSPTTSLQDGWGWRDENATQGESKNDANSNKVNGYIYNHENNKNRVNNNFTAPNTDSTLNHLRELQLSCVQSMSNLRVVKADILMENSVTATLTPLQQTVNVQAAKIVDLQQKLQRAEEIYDLLPTQQHYIVELESTVAAIEMKLNDAQRQECSYSESYNDVVASNAELKEANGKLHAKCETLEDDKQLMQEQLAALQQRAASKMIFDWNRGLLKRVYEAWSKDAAETANYKRVVLKFKAKMTNATVWRCYRGWVKFVHDCNNEKFILARFRCRMLNQVAARSFNSWCFFVSERLKLKKLAQKIFNKAVHKNLHQVSGQRGAG